MRGGSSPIWAHLLRFACVAGGYYVTGKLGLLLAIPPGYATAIWPPSGIALAALLILGPRYCLAVFVGSLLLVLDVLGDASSQVAQLRSLAIASSVALGASLQALAGFLVIRRFVTLPIQLDSERDLSLLLLIGGPLACLLSATWGTTTLWLSGAVADVAYFYTWWIWWGGDSIGVLLITPLVLLWLRRPWPANVWRSRRMLVTLPVVVSFGLVVWLFVQASAWESEAHRHEFDQAADDFRDNMRNQLTGYMAVLAVLRDLRVERGLDDRQAFARFSGHLLGRYPGIRALSWVPWVAHAEREAFEAEVQRERGGDYRIWAKRRTGELYRADDWEAYFPVRFIEPEEANRGVLGVDASTEALHLEAMQRATDSGVPAATAWAPLPQSAVAELGLHIYQPVFRTGQVPETVEQRRTDLEGFVVGAFGLASLLSSAVEDLRQDGIEFQLYDASSPVEQRFVYSTSNGVRPWFAVQGQGALQLFEWTENIGGRQWRVRAQASQAYLQNNPRLQPAAMLAQGLLFTALLGVLLLVIAGRARRVAQIVDQRTRELAQANLQLSEEIDRRSASELNLQEKNVELEKAGAAKDRFLATMSHELRTPLNAILGFTGTLLMKLPGPLTEEQHKQLQTIQGSARHLLSLINDLLDLAKIESGKVSISWEPASCRQIIAEVIDTLRPLADAKGLALRMSADLQDLTLHTDRRALSQIVINLVNNAIKYTQRGSIEIGLRLTGEAESTRVAISVSDTGCGISPEDQGRLFKAFDQLDSSTTRSHEGTGLGLYLSQRFAALLGGRITFSSELGQGSIFTVLLPLRRAP